MKDLTAFSPPPSTEMANTTTSLSLKVSCTLCTEGISLWQMVHQVAQKRTTTTLPCRSAERTVSPLASGSSNTGIDVDGLGTVSPSGGFGCSAARRLKGLRVRSIPRIRKSLRCCLLYRGIISPPFRFEHRQHYRVPQRAGHPFYITSSSEKKMPPPDRPCQRLRLPVS